MRCVSRHTALLLLSLALLVLVSPNLAEEEDNGVPSFSRQDLYQDAVRSGAFGFASNSRDLKTSTVDVGGLTFSSGVKNAVYVINNVWLAEHDNDIQLMIDQTQAGDTIYFEISPGTVVTPKRTMVIKRPITLETRPTPNTGTPSSVGIITLFTCPKTGPLFDIGTSDVVFRGFGIQSCEAETSRYAIIMVSPSDGAEFYNMLIQNNKARVFKLSRKSVTTIANSQIIDNQGKSGTIFAATKATVEATNTSFENNVGKGDYGMSIFQEDSVGIFTDCFIYNNGHKNAKGGVFRSFGGSQITMTSCSVQKNYGNNGGVVRLEDGTVTVDKCTFLENDAKTDGAILNGWDNANFIVTDSHFENNTAMNAGAAYVGQKATASFSGCTFHFNKVVDSGGVIRADFSSNVTVDNSNFTMNRCRTGDGAAIHIKHNSDVTVRNSEFYKNAASFKGGAVGLYSESRLTVYDSEFTKNRATHGGAIRIEEAAFADIIRCTFFKNRAVIDGGTINLWILAHVAISHSSFTGSSGRDGGTIFVGAVSTVEMIGTNITNGEATDNGGGIGAFFDSVLNLTDSIFDGNKGGDAGGAYIAGYTHAEITGCTFTNNHAVRKGGAIWAYYTQSLHVTDSYFAFNNARLGGGIHDEGDAIVTITRSDFLNNTARHDSAAFFAWYEGRVTVTDSSFTKNYAGHFGGAVVAAVKSSIDVQSCRFTDNVAHFDGAGLVVFNESFSTVADTTFEGQKCRNGGGLVVGSRSEANVSGCIFRDNYASYEGAAMVVFYRTFVNVSTSFFQNNRADVHGGVSRTHVMAKHLVKDCSFESNFAGEDGGAFSVFNMSNIEIFDSSFTRQRADEHGGAINIEQESKMNITTSNFTDSSADEHGGAMCVHDSEARISKVNMKNCTSEGPGTAFASFDSDIYVDGVLYRTQP